uniref:Lipid droplet assembly factor 1 n=1 Tax=Bos taurus TaxID=9913 RepID=E1BFE0_BOVIN
MDCSPPGSSVHGIHQAGILEWVAIPFSRGSPQPRDQTPVSLHHGQILYHLSHHIRAYAEHVFREGVVSFMKSPVGQYLDRHPFLTLTLLVFVALSAVPVGFFLLLVVLTSLAAFVGVILLEGLVISVGGLALLCVLCGLGFVSLVMSGTIMVSYMVISSLINYWFSLRLLPQHNSSGDCPLAVKSAHIEGLYQE